MASWYAWTSNPPANSDPPGCQSRIRYEPTGAPESMRIASRNVPNGESVVSLATMSRPWLSLTSSL